LLGKGPGVKKKLSALVKLLPELKAVGIPVSVSKFPVWARVKLLTANKRVGAVVLAFRYDVYLS
jgi:hypothetical protein